MQRKNKGRKDKSNFLFKLSLVIIVLFLSANTISLYMDTRETEEKIIAAQTELKRIENDNDRLQHVIDGDSVDPSEAYNKEYIETIARDILGYSYPGERVYILTP